MSLILPMATYVFFIMGIGVFNFITCFKGVRSGETPFKYYKSYQGELPQKAMVVGRLDTLTLLLAWSFVATRIVHTYIHLGTNKVLYRAAAFFAGWLMIAGLWIQLVISAVH